MDTPSEQIITVDLLGEVYTLKAEDNVQNPQQIADYLVAEIKRVEKQMPAKLGASKLAIMLLASMNIVNEYFEKTQCAQEVIAKLESRIQQLEEKLDEIQLV